jgi:hypothetical protein
MKILIAIGMLIIFISAFFILLTADSIFREAFECTEEAGQSICTFRGLGPTRALGVFIIAFFVMIDILTVYLIVTNLE